MSIVEAELKGETARGFIIKKPQVQPTEGTENIDFQEPKGELTAQQQYMRQLMAQDENLKEAFRVE